MKNWSKYVSWQPGQRCFYGVEIFFKENDAFEINCCLLSLKKNQLQLSEHRSSIATREDLFDYLNPKWPVAFGFTGRGVVFKTIQKTADTKTAFQLVLPDGSIDDFFLQQHSDTNSYYLTLARKDKVSPWIDAFAGAKLQMLDVFLGPLPACSVQAALLSNCDLLSLPHYTFTYSEKKLQKIAPTDRFNSLSTTIDLDGESVPTSVFLAFANAFHALFPAIVSSGIESEVLLASQQDQKYKSKLQKTGRAMVFALLLVLLGNFLTKSYYNQKYERLLSTSEAKRSELAQLELLESEIQRKEVLLTSLGIKNNRKTSFLADRVAASLPSGIVLDRMQIYPIVENPEEKSIPASDFQRLEIEGSVHSSWLFNEWVKTLQHLNWTRHIAIVDFDHKTGNQVALFHLNIYLK